MSGSGIFITFEGIEGCGKTTQIKRVADMLRTHGHQVTLTREPGGCPIADDIRAILLNSANTALVPMAELLLYAAARAQHVAEVIQPALQRGNIVLCDRFCDATIAYQGYGRRLDRHTITQLNACACATLQPDLTVVIDLDVAHSVARARRRNANNGHSDENRFELEELAFHNRVRNGYMELARQNPTRITIVAGDGDEDEVFTAVAAVITQKIEGKTT